MKDKVYSGVLLGIGILISLAFLAMAVWAALVTDSVFVQVVMQ